VANESAKSANDSQEINWVFLEDVDDIRKEKKRQK